ncbi:MAG: tetratricopeptide repeat protein [Endomicrobiales bacterium]|nr:tetratricopeptide repeat protein [Endomicrobiales bacterium]
MIGKKKKEPPPSNGNEASILEMAKFYFLNSKYNEAIAEFKKALAINPGNAEAYYNLGLIHENRNNTDEAKDMYEKALAIDPDYKLAKDHLNKLIGIQKKI